MTRRYRRALVVGKFAPLHRGHMALIDHALEIADKVLVLVWSNPDFPEMPNKVRAGWIRKLYPERVTVDYPHHVLPTLDPDVTKELRPPLNDARQEEQLDFTYGFVNVSGWGLAGDDTVDVVVSAEPYGKDIANYLMRCGPWPRVDHVTLDRSKLPISGTMAREDVHALRGMLHPEVYAHFIEPVVLMGAESTGKSTLAHRLAAELGTSWVHEYGRTYYEDHDGVMDLQGYVEIAKTHLELEDEAKLSPLANRFIVVDTNPLTTLMFSYLYERKALPELWQLAEGSVKRYKHWLVCDDDIPFEQDGWRDCEVARSRVQGLIIQDLDRRGIEYTILRGSLEERVALAMEAIGA